MNCFKPETPLASPLAWLALTVLFTGWPIALNAQTGAADCWLWPGADPSPCQDANRIYLMQGHFYRDGRFERQGPSPGRAPRQGRELVLVYRMDWMPPHGALLAAAAPAAHAWRKRGWRVLGLQVDFDCPTGKLGRYADWIATENERLRHAHAHIRILSVTGLGDWLVSGRATELLALNRVAGTIAFIFYHNNSALRRTAKMVRLGGQLPVEPAAVRLAGAIAGLRIDPPFRRRGQPGGGSGRSQR